MRGRGHHRHLLRRPRDRVAEEAELRECLAPAQLRGKLVELVVAEAEHLGEG